jgi:hypothetical protein
MAVPFLKATIGGNNLGGKNVAQDICIKVVAANFESSPAFGPLPDKYVKKVTDILPLDLPLELAGTVRGQGVHS